ncbi:hypothetical protein [Scytonema millei]|uniref:Uncharacterized protein n=1 Tax=Scytonema millei VB511283 TaxID=1245923 RepID=A0A9X5E5S4_9CYAN|nr:hypothetical protein [Scytonema millei]NHC35870.1 hypothetical protein [Scytonema millei VB511283]
MDLCNGTLWRCDRISHLLFIGIVVHHADLKAVFDYRALGAHSYAPLLQLLRPYKCIAFQWERYIHPPKSI